MNPNTDPQQYRQPDDDSGAPADTPLIQPLSPVAPTAPPQPVPTSPLPPASTQPEHNPQPDQAVNSPTPVEQVASTQPAPTDIDQAEINDNLAAPAPETVEGDGIAEWTASEYVHHDKGSLWFIGLAVATLAGAGLAAYFSQWIFAALIVVMGVVLGIFAGRPPKEVHYKISSEGVVVGERVFPLSQFKSFGVLSEGAFYSVQLRPVKRLMPGVAIYFSEADGEEIFDVLAAYLPIEEIKPDQMDKFVRWLRF